MYCLIFVSMLAIGCRSLNDYQTNDIEVLNYALTLEHLEYAYYRNGFANYFSAQSFLNAGYNSSVYNYVQMIMMHESNHVDYLTAAIKARGGTPVSECTYNFGTAYDSPFNFLAVAAVLENTGTGAYDGAISRITELGLQTAAATVATVEGRHASYLNLITGKVPFPSAFDNATTPDEVIAAASTFIVSCDAITTNTNIRPQFANFTENLPNDQTKASANDVAVLKYALTLEQLELTFYNQGLANFTDQDFINAGYNSTVREYITLIQGHENTHVATLSQVIISMVGNNDVLPCQYNFQYTDVNSFLKVASLLENTGVQAYDGAIDGITSLDYRQVAATIATVEARHAAYLNLIIGSNPFPMSFDIASNETTILAAASTFIISGSCPYDLSEVNFVPANFSKATLEDRHSNSADGRFSLMSASIVLMSAFFC